MRPAQELCQQQPQMSKDFEGTFIIFENIAWGFKWKTGFHEEQIKIADVGTIPFKNEESINSYSKLAEIFSNKTI